MRLYTIKLACMLALTLPLTGCFDVKVDADKENSESVINIAMMQPPRTGLSPLSDDAFKLSRWSTAETLVNLNAQSNAEPMLATAWEQIDPLTWHFTVRQGVTFHDGSTLDAFAVTHSLQKALEAAPKPRILDGIDLKIKALNDSTVEINTTFNDPLLSNRLSSPQLAILASDAYKENGQVIPTGMGTGPFELVNINGSTSAELRRFNGYWGEKAQIDVVHVEYVPNGFSRAAALRTGTADIVEAVPVSQIATIDSELLHEVAMPRTNTLYLNNQSKVFSQIALRKTAAAAINRQQIVEMVYENHADIAQGLFGPALAWAAPLRPEAPLLDKNLKANGETIVIGTFTDRAELPEVAAILKQQFEAVGFNVKLDIREYAQIENDALAGKFDAFILSRATVLDSGDPVAYMMSDFGCQGSYNLGLYCSKDVDSALYHADLQSLGAKRQQAIIEAEQKILNDYAAIPLLHERVIQGESKRVNNVIRDPSERRLINQQTQVN
ncbi:ABC transporter substrate-binding protein [Aliivibrio sp. 1S165]|uniref:ABC transporter substrate-binding protein n=1 Tax=unclassified Aliivibrio TaxID=2645654 RepID=UPI00080E68C5|nr:MULTISPECIES: ABC transporter substrate-binding protein [unclassified Aliivibrio]OCH18165.1 ABC transporter substrate-binding protein [Aliivibrio sp. 1S165]OCH35542.1 ABC transporter substrate-binding protein [Aliivibrio sp. 1S175]